MLNLPDLDQLIADGYISVQKHPYADLFIYNYTHKTQFSHMWNETTEQCRGLILDANHEVVARPFRKFFNLGEYTGELPIEPFDVFEKLDGSLCVSFQLNCVPYVATRGSFTSEQATKANDILHTKYRNVQLRPDYTYLFEVIYPENRIVVNYGNQEDLVLLAVIETATGRELPLNSVASQFPFQLPIYYGMHASPDTLVMDGQGEGYVLYFPRSGLRLKVKFAEYVRLHKLITRVNERDIWELLRNEEPFDSMLSRVPDEYFRWFRSVVANLTQQYDMIEASAREAFVDLGNRRLNAEEYKKFAYPGLLFAMLDGKPYDQAIWKILRPAAARPFKVEVE